MGNDRYPPTLNKDPIDTSVRGVTGSIGTAGDSPENATSWKRRQVVTQEVDGTTADLACLPRIRSTTKKSAPCNCRATAASATEPLRKFRTTGASLRRVTPGAESNDGEAASTATLPSLEAPGVLGSVLFGLSLLIFASTDSGAGARDKGRPLRCAVLRGGLR